MNDEKLELSEVPTWLQQSGAATLSDEQIITNGLPEPLPAATWTDPPPAGDPIPELAPQPAEEDAETAAEVDPQVLDLANGLIQFKRFWTTPAGTANEAEAAFALASMIIGFFEKPKPEEIDNGAQPQRSRTRRKPS